MKPVDHALLTRFNLPSPGAESLVRSQEGWLRRRVQLFEEYCLPSVLAQTAQEHSWLVYFDPESPDWLMSKIAGWAATGRLTPRFTKAVSRDDLVRDLRAVTRARTGHLLTTNLDNDDAIAVDFVARLQEAATSEPRTAIYFSQGLILSGNGVYARRDRRNAFCSVRESWDAPQTCWSEWHNLLGQHMAVLEIDGRPAWLQVVHGTNVSNRVRGRRDEPLAHRDLFPGLLDEVPSLAPAEARRDRFVNRPARMGRDIARAMVKWVALRIVGKDGFDRLKGRYAALRARG